MNLQETNEIRELMLDEMDEVSGGWLRAVIVIGSLLLTDGGMSPKEFVERYIR